MRYPGGSWVPHLQASLARDADLVDPSRMYVTTRYTPIAGEHDRLVVGICDLVTFMFVAIADVADNPSWQSGGSIARAAWDRLLRTRHGHHDELKAYIGEILAWWHEETSPQVSYAGRPFPSVAQPVIDSLSLLECDPDHVIRAVQAKATFAVPRPRFHEALSKFGKLQAGDYDEFWAESIRRFQLELRADGAPGFDAAAVASGRSLMHFCVHVSHRRAGAGDPARDYHPRLLADPPHGRAAALVHHPSFEALITDVAACIAGRIA
jgi:hypothetical protein